MMQLNELDEFKLTTYENAKIYEEKTKRWHDARIRQRTFQVGEKVLVYNSHLHLFLRQLKYRWSGPFELSKVFPYRVLEMKKKDGATFKINTLRVKAYYEVFQQVQNIVHLSNL